MYQLRKACTINTQRNVPKPNSTKILHKNFESADYSCHHFHRKIKHQSQSLSQHLMKLFFFHFFLLLSLFGLTMWMDIAIAEENLIKVLMIYFCTANTRHEHQFRGPKLVNLLTIMPTPHKKHCDFFFHKSSK